MDIHRSRFVPYIPSAINALAFSHPPDTGLKGRGSLSLRLALGRANGDIEIWNPLRGIWVQETILRGGKDKSIEGLAWTQDPAPEQEDATGQQNGGKLRLFSIGYSTTVTEWDIEQGKPARHANANFGQIWCMAAQPQWKTGKDKHGKLVSEPTAQHLALGCADGTIVIMSTEDDDLKYLRTLGQPPTKKPRVLSITFKDRNTVVAGYSDSALRAFDIRNKILLRNMSLGAGAPGGPKEILVWSVKCLPDGTIVSGDSTGEIRFWDAKNYSLFQRIHGHEADVLDLAASADGKTVFSGGADRKTIAYKLQAGKKNDRHRRWVKLMHRRFHQHDVKALAVYETQDLSVVVSGGLDTKPIVMPLRAWQKENHRTLSSLPATPQVTCSAHSRLLITWWNQEVNIWHIPKSRTSLDGTHQLLSKLLVQGEDSLTSAHLSEDGKYLTVATVSEVRLFSITAKEKKESLSLKVKKMELPSAISRNGARLVLVSPDSRWLLIIRPNQNVLVAKIAPSSAAKDPPKVLGQLITLSRPNRTSQSVREEHGSLVNYPRTVRCAAFSADSRIVAVGDLSGFVDSWVLEGHEDVTQDEDGPKTNGVVKKVTPSSSSESDSSDDDSSDNDMDAKIVQGQHWLRNPAPSPLPCLGSAILCLSFRPQNPQNPPSLTNGNVGLHPTRHNPHPHSHDLPAGEDRLIAITAEHHIIEFDVLKGKLSNWSRRNPPSCLPRDFTLIKDRAMGCFWDIGREAQRLWLYGSKWLFMFDLCQDLPRSADLRGPDAQREAATSTKSLGKRKRDVSVPGSRRNTGAGDSIDVSKSYVGVGDEMRKLVGTNDLSAQMVSLSQRRREGPNDDDPDDDDDDETGLTLARTRRDDAENEQDNHQTQDESSKEANGVVNVTSGAHNGARKWWYTFKYGPIFGVLPITHGDGAQVENSVALAVEESPPGVDLEVIIIERPMWDVELPPRYDGGRDWAT